MYLGFRLFINHLADIVRWQLRWRRADKVLLCAVVIIRIFVCVNGLSIVLCDICNKCILVECIGLFHQGSSRFEEVALLPRLLIRLLSAHMLISVHFIYIDVVPIRCMILIAVIAFEIMLLILHSIRKISLTKLITDNHKCSREISLLLDPAHCLRLVLFGRLCASFGVAALLR